MVCTGWEVEVVDVDVGFDEAGEEGVAGSVDDCHACFDGGVGGGGG